MLIKMTFALDGLRKTTSGAAALLNQFAVSEAERFSRLLYLILLLLMSSCDANDPARQALMDAKRLTKEGDYKGALAKHVWYHEHALSINRSYYGVRLSFALSDWIQLGGVYPEALETLKAIRDSKTSKLLNGDLNRELFHDVAAINRHLSESLATVALFKRLEAGNPEFATDVYSIAEEALVEAQEYVLARKYLGDPKARLSQERQNLEWGLQYAETKGRDAARNAHERIFASEAVRIITILKETGEEAEAKRMQLAALEALDHESIRNALK